MEKKNPLKFVCFLVNSPQRKIHKKFNVCNLCPNLYFSKNHLCNAQKQKFKIAKIIIDSIYSITPHANTFLDWLCVSA